MMLKATREKFTILHISLQVVRKSNWRPVFVRQIQLPFKSRVTEVLSSESLPPYKHISGERKVISEGGFQIQEGVLGKKLGGSK